MKFKCNNTEYKIIEKEQLDTEETVGLTEYQKKQVLLKKLDKDLMIRTLKHELMHVWLYEYGHNQDDKEFNCEDVCEIVACSNDFINEVVKQYENKNNNDNYTEALRNYMEYRNEHKQKH